MVAARHLKHFGYTPVVYYPKRSTKGDGLRLFGNLVKQLEDLNISFLEEFPSTYGSTMEFYLETNSLPITSLFSTECSALASMEHREPPSTA